MATKTEKLLEDIASLTILEAAELKKMMEEKFGVTAAAPMAMAAVAAAPVEEKDALTLLKEKAEVVQDTSGLVVQINKRKADEQKREYWSFYVNEKMASVGPKDYVTKDTDRIEWKIEKF